MCVCLIRITAGTAVVVVVVLLLFLCFDVLLMFFDCAEISTKKINDGEGVYYADSIHCRPHSSGDWAESQLSVLDREPHDPWFP